MLARRKINRVYIKFRFSRRRRLRYFYCGGMCDRDPHPLAVLTRTLAKFVSVSRTIEENLAKFPHSPIHHYTSIYGALLFSVSPVRCTCIIKYRAVRKFFRKFALPLHITAIRGKLQINLRIRDVKQRCSFAHLLWVSSYTTYLPKTNYPLCAASQAHRRHKF